MTNVLNKDYFQLTMLNINTVLYLTPNKFQGLDEYFNCVHIPIDEVKRPDIDFDMLSDQVQELMNDESKAPLLLLCLSGHLSGALAMKVCLDTNKTFTKELASMYVMQRRYELKEIEHWLFGQIQPYIPPNKRIQYQKKKSQELSSDEEEEFKENDDGPCQALLDKIEKYKAANADSEEGFVNDKSLIDNKTGTGASSSAAAAASAAS